ncbi:hypothetical protein [Arthrobacter sp. CAN_A6]|uniref:hypothetical protein n=1 Tax=Arthrobacter sp. CAN_A6 TaxID=2787721 RepID=UPI002FF17FEE
MCADQGKAFLSVWCFEGEEPIHAQRRGQQIADILVILDNEGSALWRLIGHTSTLPENGNEYCLPLNKP